MNDTVKLPRIAKGKRPSFFRDPGVDQLYSIAVELAAELSVALDRIDTLEQLLDTKSVVTHTEIEDYRPDARVEAQRADRRDAYLQRVFRILEHEDRVTPDEASSGTD